MRNVVMLPLFVLFNVAVLTYLWRWARREAEPLLDTEERDEALRRYSLDELAEGLFGVLHYRDWRNPVRRLRAVVGITGALLVADFFTVRQLWPWLLP